MLHQALDEAEAECTLDRYRIWYRKEIAVVFERIRRPHVPSWYLLGQEEAERRYLQERERTVHAMWRRHRATIRARVENMIAKQAIVSGDYQLRQHGGSLTEFLQAVEDDHAARKCLCFMAPKIAAMRQAREAWELAGQALARALGKTVVVA
jgi:hypothetical protein